jgi:hypothetical protein
MMKSKQSNNRLMLMSALAPILALSLFTGCNAPESGSSAATAPAGLNAPTGTSTGSASTGTGTTAATPSDATGAANAANVPAVGESCVSGDANKVCLAIHFVAYQDSAGTVTADETEAATIIRTMNQLWAQCDIGFQIQKYEVVDPTAHSLVYGAGSQNQLDQIRTAFKTPADEMLAVTTGPWGTAVNAWTNMPGSNVYGAVMENSIVGYGGGIIYAHEFGHYLGLDHVGNTSNLMNAIIYTTSTSLTASQCQAAKSTAKSYWSAMVRK